MLETIKPAPVETVTPLRPSEAMRLGCLTTTQVFGGWGYEGTACALAAMVRGSGDDLSVVAAALYDLSPPDCPVCDRDVQSAGTLVTHLNDHHRWTREAIADWLEGQGL